MAELPQVTTAILASQASSLQHAGPALEILIAEAVCRHIAVAGIQIGCHLIIILKDFVQ
jgi:hypothetical protein